MENVVLSTGFVQQLSNGDSMFYQSTVNPFRTLV